MNSNQYDLANSSYIASSDFPIDNHSYFYKFDELEWIRSGAMEPDKCKDESCYISIDELFHSY